MSASDSAAVSTSAQTEASRSIAQQSSSASRSTSILSQKSPSISFSTSPTVTVSVDALISRSEATTSSQSPVPSTFAAPTNQRSLTSRMSSNSARVSRTATITAALDTISARRSSTPSVAPPTPTSAPPPPKPTSSSSPLSVARTVTPTQRAPSTPGASPTSATPAPNGPPQGISQEMSGGPPSVLASAQSQVAGIQSAAARSTMTVTGFPSTTFQNPVSITMTREDGQALATAPAVITSLSLSTAADGSVATFTAIIANPVSDTNVPAAGRTGFLNNTGAVAGVFLSIGLVVAGVFLFLFICIRKRRRQYNNSLNSMDARIMGSANPFADSSSVVHSQSVHRDGISWGARANSVRTESENGHMQWVGAIPVHYTSPPSQPPMAQIPGRPYSYRKSVPSQDDVGVAITTRDTSMDYNDRLRSTQSSPSLYPATLGVNDDDSFYAPDSPPPVPSLPDRREDLAIQARNSMPPPLSPKSSARFRVPPHKSFRAYEPMTPPTSASESSHGGPLYGLAGVVEEPNESPPASIRARPPRESIGRGVGVTAY